MTRLLGEFLFVFVLVASTIAVAAALETLESLSTDPYIWWIPAALYLLLLLVVLGGIKTSAGGRGCAMNLIPL